ncbi:UNKNOWN [Stylonychia lemnae]|uniref:Uncharacterized protein n=1 Tax=Stylonychia lemnae TaxID=5949 RepID=A0A078ASH7_STYLE|nr:UNKNOWN [Stylonychia lemnae]|eukprot:CDW83843.1 UNKNOWN [Stylonychia lemnae]
MKQEQAIIQQNQAPLQIPSNQQNQIHQLQQQHFDSFKQMMPQITNNQTQQAQSYTQMPIQFIMKQEIPIFQQSPSGMLTLTSIHSSLSSITSMNRCSSKSSNSIK